MTKLTPKDNASTSTSADPRESRAAGKDPPNRSPRIASPDALVTLQRKVQGQQQAPIQKQESPGEKNSKGLPSALKTGVEQLSGVSMDDVQVHYNSDKPKQLESLAYTQGTEIHVGPGQESTLPHEAWHAVQQLQGRVKPTVQFKGKLSGNDDAALETEADVMGAKALALGSEGATMDHTPLHQGISKPVVQCAGQNNPRQFSMKVFKSKLLEDNPGFSARSKLIPLLNLLGGDYDETKDDDMRVVSNGDLEKIMHWVHNLKNDQNAKRKAKFPKYEASFDWLAQQLGGIQWLRPEVKRSWAASVLPQDMYFAHCTSAPPDKVQELHPKYSTEWVMPQEEDTEWAWNKFVFSFGVSDPAKPWPDLKGARNNNYLRDGNYCYVFKLAAGTPFMNDHGSAHTGKEIGFPQPVPRSSIVKVYHYRKPQRAAPGPNDLHLVENNE